MECTITPEDTNILVSAIVGSTFGLVVVVYFNHYLYLLRNSKDKKINIKEELGLNE